MPGPILLLTDFSNRDAYPAIMKGVIWSIAPQAVISDLTHEIPPQDVRAGALVLGRAAPFFPPGTVFVAVVDPGVGGARRPLAARLGEQFFIAPDNGLLTLPLERAEQAGAALEIVHLNRSRYWLAQVSRTFHGRDIFAPTAAHLANGVALAELGSPVTDPVRLRLPTPRATPTGWLGEVTLIDTFGNLATNLTREHLSRAGLVEVRIAGECIEGTVATYGEVAPGSLAALLDSAGSLSIAVVNGSAAAVLRAGIGEPVELVWADE